MAFALLAAPAIAKGLLGLYQSFQHVNRQDSTTEADREMLGLARQQAAAAPPGYAQQLALLGRGQNATVQAATLGAGSGSDLLAAGSAAARQYQQGVQALGSQYETYRDASTRNLQNQLARQSAREQADTQRAQQANAQLKGAAINNLNGALTDAASVAAYEAATKDASAVAAPTPTGTLPLPPPPVTDYGNPVGGAYGGYRSRRAGLYGGYGPTY